MTSDQRWDRVWPAASVGVWLLGVAARCIYVLRLHHPRHYVVTDVRQLIDLAQKLIDAPASQAVSDTIWPPGTSAILAVLLARDPTGGIAADFQLLLSCLLPLLVAHTAYLIGGRKLAAVALALASLHPGFIHSAGFFLSEQFFQFAIGLAMWASVAAVVLEQRSSDRAGNRVRALAVRVALGFAVGTSWGLAASFRPNALPVALLVGTGLAAHWWREHRRQALSLLAGGLAGLVLIVAPMTHRCSVLKGAGFCPVSNNIAMNVALGQVDEVAGLEFFDPKAPHLDTSWSPPGLLQHGYAGTLRVPFTIYDVRAIAGWVWQRIAVDPERFALRVARNVIDLFRVDSWPPTFGPVPAAAHQVWGWLFFGGVVIPGLIGLRRAWRERGSGATLPVLLCLVVLAVMVVAAGSLGEPRYRYPFDGVLIAFAGMVLLRMAPARARAAQPAATRTRHLAVGLSGVASIALATAAVIAVVSDPASQAARPAAQTAAVMQPPLRREATEFARPVAVGSPFDAPGNHLFDCEAACTELRLSFPDVEQSRFAELSLDDNDRYRVTFYRRDVALGHVDLPREQLGGMRVATIEAPAAAAAGYDAVGIIPLYGDRHYALGHLRLWR
jgi:hypothetical protein